MFWLKIVSEGFRDRFLSGNVSQRRLNILTNFRSDITADIKQNKPGIYQALATVSSYDALISMWAENILKLTLNNQILHTSLTCVSLLHVAVGVGIGHIRRGGVSYTESKTTEDLVEFAREIVRKSLSHQGSGRQFEMAVQKLKIYLSLLHSHKSNPRRWSQKDWQEAIINSDYYVLPELGFSLIAAEIGRNVPEEWYDNFRKDFVSMIKICDELSLWKENLLKGTPCVLWSAVNSHFRGHADLNQIAYFIYASPDGAWLTSELSTCMSRIIGQIPQEWGSDVRRFLLNFVNDSERVIYKFDELRQNVLGRQ